MDCFPDFCLACDKQTIDGFYCSQACRLADMEKAGTSATPSPLTYNFENTSWPAMQLGLTSGFHLPPAVNFPIHKTSGTGPVESRCERAYQPEVTRPQHSSFHSTSVSHRLTPSSSRSSLTSATENGSLQNSVAISEQAKHELRDYFSAFDQTREMKRRSLSSNVGH